jgi:hypothetical protein
MTMRVSISTCGSGWSRSVMSRRMESMFSCTSVMMSVLLRPSYSTAPRLERRRLTMGRMPGSVCPLVPPEKLCPVEPPE